MKRLHLFEIHEQKWCPRAIRDAETEYLQFVIAKMKGYAPVVPVLAAALPSEPRHDKFSICVPERVGRGFGFNPSSPSEDWTCRFA